MDVLHIKRLLYYQRHFLSGLELHERSDWRATATDTHQLYSDTICSSLYIHWYIFGVQLRMTTHSCALRLHTTHQNNDFIANDALLYKNKVG